MAISESLIKQIKARAADPEARTDAPPMTGTSFGGGAFRTIVTDKYGNPPPAPAPMLIKATMADIWAAEKALGFDLPTDLKHLYGEVANGGFGPHGGLAPLVKIVEKFKRLTAEPQGENGEAWLAHLLPIVLSDPGLDAYDLTSGKIIQWNEEFLDEGPAHWENSFRTVASSLEIRLLNWVNSPRPADKTRDITTNASLEHLRRTLPVLRAMTRDEREAIGVMGNDWEAEMCRAHGIDLNDLTA